MDSDFNDVDVVSELNILSNENKYQEIVDLLRENLYQFNKDPYKLISLLTLRIYYNLHLKNFNDVDSDFEMIQSLFTDRLNHQFEYTRDSKCEFSTFLIYSYYPHLKGSSFLSLDRLYKLFEKLQNDLNEKNSKESQEETDTYSRNEEEDSKDEDSRTHSMEFNENVHRTSVKRLMKTVLLISDILTSLTRPLEAIKLLKTVNLKHDENDKPTNLMLSLIYRKLGYQEESDRYMNVLIEGEKEHENIYKGILKVFKRDYEGAIEHFKSTIELESLNDSEIHLRGHEMVLVNNLAVSMLYANRSQEAKNMLSNLNMLNEGFQAQRGISSSADVLKELSIYD